MTPFICKKDTLLLSAFTTKNFKKIRRFCAMMPLNRKRPTNEQFYSCVVVFSWRIKLSFSLF